MTKPKAKKDSTIITKARRWAAERKLFGAQAFLRYVMLCFLDALNQVSDDFVFKGGNLLWLYIDTPRATVDLDLATRKINTDSRVREVLEKAGSLVEGIEFAVTRFSSLEQDNKRGASVTIEYNTEAGARNSFELDIVYQAAGLYTRLQSPTKPEHRIQASTIEEIIADKVATCWRFGSGNSRMKDFDDLWRLAKGEASVDSAKLKRILTSRKISDQLDLGWINDDMDKAWASHRKRYKDLPESLKALFRDVNDWLRTKLTSTS